MAIFLVYGFAFYICTSANVFVYFIVPPFRRWPLIYTYLFWNLLFSHLLLNVLKSTDLTHVPDNKICGIGFEESVQNATRLLETCLLLYTGFTVAAVKLLQIPHGNRFSFLLVLSLTGTIWAVAVYTAFLFHHVTL